MFDDIKSFFLKREGEEFGGAEGQNLNPEPAHQHPFGVTQSPGRAADHRNRIVMLGDGSRPQQESG